MTILLLWCSAQISGYVATILARNEETVHQAEEDKEHLVQLISELRYLTGDRWERMVRNTVTSSRNQEVQGGSKENTAMSKVFSSHSVIRMFSQLLDFESHFLPLSIFEVKVLEPLFNTWFGVSLFTFLNFMRSN